MKFRIDYNSCTTPNIFGERGTWEMDHYAMLKVPPGASQGELDRAYQKLIKDSRYDNTINRKEIDAAYRTLSDATQRALYDATQADRAKREQASQKIKKAAFKQNQPRQRPLTIALVIFLLMAVIYLPLRFGYQLKRFNVGDSLYFKDDHQYFGKITRVENNHNFGRAAADAYLIQTKDGEDLWWPAGDVKVLCVEK